MNQSPFDFDRNFRDHQRTMRTGFRVFGAAWLISLLVSLAVVVAVVCVAWHFIAKFW